MAPLHKCVAIFAAAVLLAFASALPISPPTGNGPVVRNGGVRRGQSNVRLPIDQSTPRFSDVVEANTSVTDRLHKISALVTQLEEKSKFRARRNRLWALERQMKKVVESGDPLAEYKTLKLTVDAMRKNVSKALVFEDGQEIYEVMSLSSFLDILDKMDKELVEEENKGSSGQLVMEVTQGLNRMGLLITLLEGESKAGAHKNQWDDLDNRMEQLIASLPKSTLEEYKTQQGALHATKKELWERNMWNGLSRINAEIKARGTVDKFVACIEEMDKKVAEEEKKGSLVEGQ